MSVNIKYKNNSIAELSNTGTKTLKTAGKYCEADIIVENTKDGITPSGNKAITATTSTQTGIDVTNYATVSVAPTPSETKSVTTNGDVTPSSGKLLSKVTVNVPTGTARDSSDLTVSGATVNVPAGLYSSAASKSVASGTAGTPTASKSAVSNHSVTVTPSVTNTEGYIAGGTKTGTGVKVSASELVSGNKAITPSETAQSGIDVTNFKTASVGAISSTYVGSGVTRKAAATVAPSTSEQTVCASGVYTTGEQKVSAITPSIVGNLDASSFAASIVAAIEGKGVTVPAGTLLDGMASLIESIEAGGGGGASNIVSGTFTPTGNGKSEIEHNLNLPPNFWCVYATGSGFTDYSLGLMFEYLPHGYNPATTSSQDAIAVALGTHGNSPFYRSRNFMRVNSVAIYKDKHESSDSLISEILSPEYLPANKKYLGVYVGTPSEYEFFMTVGVTYHWIVGVI